MNKLPVKQEFKYEIIGCHRDVNPYTMAFVYPQKGKPFIVKGGLNDVEKYLEDYTDKIIQGINLESIIRRVQLQVITNLAK